MVRRRYHEDVDSRKIGTTGTSYISDSLSSSLELIIVSSSRLQCDHASGTVYVEGHAMRCLCFASHRCRCDWGINSVLANCHIGRVIEWCRLSRNLAERHSRVDEKITYCFNRLKQLGRLSSVSRGNMRKLGATKVEYLELKSLRQFGKLIGKVDL